jgi:hypothetical protein
VDGVVHGDAKKVSQGVGGLIVKSNSPIGAVVAQTILDGDTKKFAEEVVGRGFILLATTDSPELVVTDAVGNIIDHFTMTNPPQNPIAPTAPAPQPRERQSYTTSKATCMVRGKDGSVTAGWIDSPVITNVQTGEKQDFMTADVRENDYVDIDADVCTFENQGNGAQTSVTHLKVLYKRRDPRVGPASGMRWFLVGSALEG